MRRGALAIALTLAATAAAAPATTKLLRYPDLHGDRVVFCYGGDLWTAPVTGGTAVRLTAHPGVELFPRFSPDGRWIAFTGQYDGDEQVYVIPAAGGEPRQLTHYPARGPLPPRWGSDNQVLGWTPDGAAVLFRSMRDAGGGSEGRVYTVSLEGGLPEPLPMPDSGAADLSPDGTKVVYSPLARDFRTWKRYEGGWAQDLFVFDLATHEAIRIAASRRTERDPMWLPDGIYFVSDRDGWLNLYRYDPSSGEVVQLTRSTTWDVRWPGDDGVHRIVYEFGGELRVYDTRTGEDRPVPIAVPDDGLWKRRHEVEAARFVEGWELGPTGRRAVFAARGDILTVPAKKGPVRNLTRSPGAHDREPAWSPDGRWIAYLSDATGEEELYVVRADGSGAPRQLTSDGTMRRMRPVWSPDSRRIAFSDKEGRIWVTDVESGRKPVLVADERNGQVTDYSWSPDGTWLAFSLSEPTRYRSIWLWNAGTLELHRVTGPDFNEHQPVWDPEGRYLYFLGTHGFAPQISQIEWNFAGNRMTGIYALALAADTPAPFPPESDEEGTDGGEGGPGEETGRQGGDGERKAPQVRIDLDGLARRVARVPVPFDNYVGLKATGRYLLYVRRGAPFYGREPALEAELHLFDLDKRKDSVIATGVRGYSVSADGKKVLIRTGSRYLLYDLKPKPGEGTALPVERMRVEVDPSAEWRQIFWEVWRRYRDFFYVPNMHGYDWESLGKRYATLLPHVAHRADLNYLIGEMIAELNAGHCYISGGDYDLPERPEFGLPGARFELDRASGRYRIATIFRGQNEEPRYRSPLTEIGVDARVGDYVLAIDGKELRAPENPYRLLRGKGDRPVTLTLNDRPVREGARTVTYRPVTSERALIYNDWVVRNREYVRRRTDGRVGYIHIPNMGADGAREFLKWFYPQVRTEGLIVDERSNGGGNISQWIIERLRRILLGLDFSRTAEDPTTYPSAVHVGPKVCLINGTTASDGDIFAYMFRQAGLGPLIGTRTWGGVIGITGRGPLIDGGEVYVPEFGNGSADGRWVVEGIGVEPDIVVEQDPKALLEGRDPQLDRAIEEILRRLPSEPQGLPPRPAPPVKTPRPVSG